MPKQLSAICLLVLLLSCKQKPTQSTTDYPQDVQAKIQQVENSLAGWVQTQDTAKWTLQSRMAFYHLNGLSIAVIHNGQIEWAKAYGLADSAEQRPVTTQTLFQAASISKSLNGVGVMKLAQDKKIDLYADINQYLTTWKFPYDTVSKGKKISVANLLSHTGGLTVHGFPGYARGDSIPTLVQILNGSHPANSDPIRSQDVPGVKSVYSGGGITISQLILMDVTHQPYDQWMYDNVLEPMGMTQSSYRQPPAADKQALLATGYRAGGTEIKGKYHIYPEQAAAGLWTNPTDLCKYIIETQQSYAGKSSKVLSQSSTTTRLTPFIDSNAAMGVFILNRGGVKWFSHGGANEGFRSQYYGSLSNGDGVAVMVNSDNGAILDEVINAVATVYGWKDFYVPVKKTAVNPPAATLQSYVGKYVLGTDTITVAQNGTGLTLDADGTVWKLYFTSPKDFFVYEDRAAFAFVTEGNKVTGFSINTKEFAKKIK